MGYLLGLILGLAIGVVAFVVMNGLAMILIGAVGHWFDIVIYQYISFWEVAGILFIGGVLGFSGRR